jgi:glycosyltransferase involved in cell wall biosynthesis
MPPDPRPIAIYLPGLGREGLGGGAERVAVTLATEFHAAGRSVDLLLSVVHPAPLESLPADVRVFDLRSPRLWTSMPALSAYRWRERPLAVLSLMPLANVLNVLSAWIGPRGSRTAVLSEHSFRSIALSSDFREEGTRLLHPLCRLTYPRADAVVGCSSGVADRVRQRYPMLGDRCVGITNPVAPSTSDPEATRAHPWLLDAVPCIVALGRLHAAKDPMTLLATIARVRERRPVRALLLGDGPLRSAVESEIERLGLTDHVDLVGYVREPRGILAQAELLLHTARWEGFPLVLVEALAEGVPIVSTDCESGPREILEGGKYGRLAPVGDVEGLADAVIATLDEPRRPERLQARAMEFAPAAIARQYLDLLDAVSA